MRFCDLFISYKIGLKEIKNLIPFTKLPFYRKVAVIWTFVFSVSSILVMLINYQIIALIILLIAIVGLLVFLIIDSTKRNLYYMLKNHYTPYSRQRMDMVLNVLKQYSIDIHSSDRIDALVSEAEKAKLQSDYLAPLKKPIKTLGAIIIPIVVFVARKITDTTSQSDMITMALLAIAIILLLFSIFLSLSQLVKECLYHDYNRYNDFIYDLNQIKIFYSNNTQIIR